MTDAHGAGRRAGGACLLLAVAFAAWTARTEILPRVEKRRFLERQADREFARNGNLVRSAVDSWDFEARGLPVLERAERALFEVADPAPLAPAFEEALARALSEVSEVESVRRADRVRLGAEGVPLHATPVDVRARLKAANLSAFASRLAHGPRAGRIESLRVTRDGASFDLRVTARVHYLHAALGPDGPVD